MQERIMELETKLAFQDDTVQELNRIVANQQQEIDTLKLLVKDINEKLTDLAPSNIAHDWEETPPPHY